MRRWDKLLSTTGCVGSPGPAARGSSAGPLGVVILAAMIPVHLVVSLVRLLPGN